MLWSVTACFDPRLTVEIDAATGIELVAIPSGRFQMGSPATVHGRQRDEHPHEVAVEASWLGRTEVTQAQWRDVVGELPAQPSRCDRCPVVNVDLADVTRFVARANQRSTRFSYRLPTEAEWEYACRAGTRTPFYTGATLSTRQANFDGRFPYAGTEPEAGHAGVLSVASFAANPWGLYDMHGNVWEWTSDIYRAYPGGEECRPEVAYDGELKVIRGGSFAFDANSARCALRYTHAPADDGPSLGFRVAADPRASAPLSVRSR